jgi:hypothetical protein
LGGSDVEKGSRLGALVAFRETASVLIVVCVVDLRLEVFSGVDVTVDASGYETHYSQESRENSELEVQRSSLISNKKRNENQQISQRLVLEC